MSSRKKPDSSSSVPDIDADCLRDVLGYLNFSSGNNDPGFLLNLGTLWNALPDDGARRDALYQVLSTGLDELSDSLEAFADVSQARAVLDIGLRDGVEAYRDYHDDVLFHLSEDDYEHPFFLGYLMNAVMVQGGPWTEVERITSEALKTINDYVGYRPVAVLENGRKSEIYDHERICPVPLYVTGAGVAPGRYHDLIATTLEFLQDAPGDLLRASHFLLENFDEFSFDPRAYDHSDPTNKRTNYMFGEWDPHRIDIQGDYRRFIVRKIILDSLMDWIDNEQSDIPKEERLFDAAAALCGTMLMASSISGSGPATHDSNVSLTHLLPLVAQRRDEFYNRLMAQLTGPRKDRLTIERDKAQQPFGHIRQFINMKLAGYGARQVQHRELAHLYAYLGNAEASRRQANEIPAASIRIETEIERTIAAANHLLDHGDVESAAEQVELLPELLHRGVHCGALVDPWNILGFHAQFPLFSAREDAIPDTRVEVLISMMESIFTVFSRTLGDAAAKGKNALREKISSQFQELAQWWDQFGSDVIEDLPDVSGDESWESANHVSNTLNAWQDAGEAAGDISFWRNHIDKFQSAQSYALVIDALLNKQDHVAAMGLMMQWLNQMEEVGHDSPQHTIFSLMLRWMKLVTSNEELAGTERSSAIRRLFDFLEANAESWWGVPNLNGHTDSSRDHDVDMLEFGGMEEELEGTDDDAASDQEDDLFKAAYDDVVFKDSTDDGQWGDTVDDGFGSRNTEFESLNREIEPRLKFLNTTGQLWQLAAASFAKELYQNKSSDAMDEVTVAAIVGWHRQAQRWQIDLAELMESVWDYEIVEPSGDLDANIEYDIQLQVKFYMLHQIINTLICLRNSERLLNGIIPEDISTPRGTKQDRQLAEMYRAVVQRDVKTVLEQLTPLIQRLSRNPLLYVPLEHGGTPGEILRIQALQSVIRFLLNELPGLGLLQETWIVLSTALRMERSLRPKGQAITEFDRLFHIALKRSLEAVVDSATKWDIQDENNGLETLLDAMGTVLEPYQKLWRDHSRTMRISAVDGMRNIEEWDELVAFIQRYGDELFHASQLTLGNVRAILHYGVDWFLDHLEEEQDPIKPMKLLEDIDIGILDREEAEWHLEQVYSIVVDRFDRYLEYNTTTTQSDYGSQIHCLIEFLKIEARYDRDAWVLAPNTIVHEVLVRNRLMDAAELWEASFEVQTSDAADEHLQSLSQLQQKYGIRMPTITDHLRERFVKPLAVNRMLALVTQVVNDTRSNSDNSNAFELLNDAVDEYLEDSWGSGIDVPDWLRQLEREVTQVTRPEEAIPVGTDVNLDAPFLNLSFDEFLVQTENWEGGQTNEKKE